MDQHLSSTSSVSTFADPDASDTSGPRATSQLRCATGTKERASWFQVALPAISFTGVQLGWAVQIGHATAHLRKLGLPDSEVGLVWLAGPVSGTLVQPLVGALSDRYTGRFGRRRPFILAGAVAAMVGFLVFGFAENITAGSIALALAIASFWLADIGINATQIATRTLIVDVAAEDQLVFGCALLGIASGIGKCIGFAFGTFLPSTQLTFAIAGGAVLTLAVITVVLCRESVPQITDDADGEASFLDPYKKLLSIAKNPPQGMRGVFLAQWLTYLAMMLIFVYGADWVGKNIFGGDGDAPAGSEGRRTFDEGVRFGNGAFLGMAVVSILVSAVLPTLRNLLGTRFLWAICLTFAAAACLCAPLDIGKFGVIIILVAQAGSVAAAFALPWAVLSRLLGSDYEKTRASHLAAFNLAQATPGIVGSIFGGVIVRIANGDLSAVLFVAGCIMFIAAFVVLVIDLPDLSGGLKTVRNNFTQNTRNTPRGHFKTANEPSALVTV